MITAAEIRQCVAKAGPLVDAIRGHRMTATGFLLLEPAFLHLVEALEAAAVALEASPPDRRTGRRAFCADCQQEHDVGEIRFRVDREGIVRLTCPGGHEIGAVSLLALSDRLILRLSVLEEAQGLASHARSMRET